MELVFVHGWGFDAHFWDPVCAWLSQFRQRRMDLGFYGNPSAAPPFDNEAILIGHSLGFVHGFTQKKDWGGWIAINSFPRFIYNTDQSGCVAAVELRGMKTFLALDSAKTLRGFYDRIGAEPPEGSPNVERLRSGLDELRDGDVESVFATLDAPGLVLAARNDPLVPIATSEALGRMAKKGGIMWHETGGHILPLRDPVWCAEAIQGFVQNFFG